MSIKNPRNTLEQRRQLRRDQTEAEHTFWEAVRNKQILGLRFRRQYGVGIYILDFYIPNKRLAIEIDGKIHLKSEVRIKDKNRDAFLNENGIKVIRFTNEEIENNLESSILKLKDILSKD